MLNSPKARMVLKLAGATLQRSFRSRFQLSWASTNLQSRLYQISLPTSQDVPIAHALMPERDPMKGSRTVISQSGAAIDPKLPELIAFLDQYHPENFPHDVGSFDEHLIGTWRILAYWRQPLPILRCGLFHSVYATDVYPVSLIPFSQREDLVALIGDEAEALVMLFCTVARHRLQHQLLEQGSIPKQGFEVTNWMTQERLHLPPQLIAAYLVVEVANIAEQTCSLFKKPGMWMSYTSKLIGMIRPWLTLPPVFDGCTQQLAPHAEVQARRLYQRQVWLNGRGDSADKTLIEIINTNPWIAEPYLDLAILANQRGNSESPKTYAQQGLKRLLEWCTAWDKRCDWETMVRQTLSILP